MLVSKIVAVWGGSGHWQTFQSRPVPKTISSALLSPVHLLFLKAHRPLALHVIDDERQTILSASRSFFWFLSHLHVRDGAGRPLGSLRRQFAFLKRQFVLEDASGNPIAKVQGKLLRPNTFMIYVNGSEVARVTKQWSGIMKEAFSDADTFKVQQDPGLDQDFSLMVLATAFAIDLDFFESGGGGASFSLGG